MNDFLDFMENQQFVEKVLNLFNEDADFLSAQVGVEKPWSATKQEILRIWQGLKPDLPILIMPMQQQADGSMTSYGEDGIRITGSWQFIVSILSRLKEFMAYENPQTKLRLIFRGIEGEKNSRPDRKNFAFYLNLQTRGKGKPGRKKIGSLI